MLTTGNYTVTVEGPVEKKQFHVDQKKFHLVLSAEKFWGFFLQAKRPKSIQVTKVALIVNMFYGIYHFTLSQS